MNIPLGLLTYWHFLRVPFAAIPLVYNSDILLCITAILEYFNQAASSQYEVLPVTNAL